MSTNCERRRDLGAVQLADDLFIFDERSKLLRALRATEYEPFAAPAYQFAQCRTAALLGRSWDTPAFYQPAVRVT